MTKLITILIFCYSFTTYAQIFDNKTDNERLEEHLKEIEGLTLKEITDKYNANVEALEGFMSFFAEDESEEIKAVAKDDEEYDETFSVDTTGVASALQQFKKVELKQEYTSKYTAVNFSFVPKKFMWADRLGNGVDGIYIPQKIYYKNGKIETEGVKDYVVDFHFPQNWGTPSPIDSIVIDYEINYTNKLDAITLSNATPKVTYKGGTIELLKMEHNYAYVRISNDIDNYIASEATNIEGKAIHRYSSSTGVQPLDDGDDIMQSLLSYAKEAQQKLNANEFTSVDELKKYLRKKLTGVEFFKSDGYNYQEGFYKGNLAQITLFFAEENVNKTTRFTAVSNNLNRSVIQLIDDKDLVFINNKEKELFRIKSNGRILEELTPRFLKDASNFYYLNIKKKRLDTLDVYNVQGYKNGLVSIAQKENSKYLTLFSSKNKPVSSSKYEWFDEYGDFLVGKNETGIYSINALGEESLLKGVERIRDGEEGMLIIVNENGQMGYMDSSGEIIIPMQYLNANPFSEGLAHVENKDHLFGFIDATGKIVLPFKYESVYRFVKGVTAVNEEGSFKLIDKKGTVIFNSNSGGIGISTNNEERIYNLNGKKYNSKGEIIIEDE